MIKKALKSLLAGFLIGMAGAMFLLARSQGFKFLPALVFPLGLFLICVFKLDLFTGKVGFFFDKERGIRLSDLVIMLVFNAVGAIIFGLIFVAAIGKDTLAAAAADSVWQAKFGELSISSAALTLLKSALCGMLVYIGVFLFGKSESFGGKAVAIWLPIAAFVYLGLDHSIANMFYYAATLKFGFSGAVTLIVAVIGNSVGAILFDRAIDYINK